MPIEIARIKSDSLRYIFRVKIRLYVFKDIFCTKINGLSANFVKIFSLSDVAR